jgi:hypothetical protein
VLAFADGLLRGFATFARIEAPALSGDGAAEVPEVPGVTAEQALWFLSESEDPFGAALLHPHGCAGQAASKKIDGAAHADGDRNSEGAIVHVDPFFLLGTAKADEEEVGLGGEDAIANIFVIHLQEFVERRRIISSEFEFWVFLFGFGDSGFDGVGRGTEEEGAIAFFRGDLEEEWDEIGTGDAFGKRITEKFGSPHEWSAIAEDEVGIEKDAAEFDIVRGLDEKIDIGGDEVMGPARSDHIVNDPERFGGANIVERNAENRDRRGCGERKALLESVHFQ